jgi:hypothetical protein
MMCDAANPLVSAPPSAFELAASRAADLRGMIVELNNRAIHCLQQQKSDEASYLLTDGMCVLEVHGHCYQSYVAASALQPAYRYDHRAGPHMSSSSSLSSAISASSVGSCCPTRGPKRRPINVRLPERKGQDNLPTAIYNRAFLLDHDDPMDANFDMAVLAFNNGLSYHLQGIDTCDANESKRQALFWYGEAHRLLLLDHPTSMVSSHSSLFHCMGRHHSRWMILLAAAVCHNMAAIHGDDFWDFGSARLLRCQLAQVIHWEGHRFSQMDTDDFVFFHLVIFFAIIDDFRIAPAA